MNKKTVNLSDEELKVKSKKLTEELSFARAALQKQQAIVKEMYDKLKVVNEEIDKRLIESNRDDYALALEYEEGRDSTVRYENYQRVISELGLYPAGGVWTLTGQRRVSLSLSRHDTHKNQKQIEALKKLLPYIKAIETANDEEIIGTKPVDIFEWTLSEHGVYNIYIRPDNSVILSFTRYSNTTYKDIGDFDKAMAYIAKHHWYGDTDDNNDDDDNYH